MSHACICICCGLFGLNVFQTSLKELCQGEFQIFGQNCLKLEVSNFVVHQRARYQVNFQGENKPLSEFLRVFQDRSNKLEILASFFFLATLQSNTLILTLRALVE